MKRGTTRKQTWKRQTFWTLPVYTGDVSGVCSALYELGGMVVMHDPSGCNSTYNTHDEIRWMDMESLIFLSGLRDIDAITGNDRKLIDDIVESASAFHPKFIAIAASPVPWLIGTDIASICRSVYQETGIPAFHVETNAMHDYTYGAGHAFLELAKMLFGAEDSKQSCGEQSGLQRQPAAGIRNCRQMLPEPDSSRKQEDRIKVNVLGVTPLDFTVRPQIQALRDLLGASGFDIVSLWGIGDDLDTLHRAPEADVNLVVSSCGLPAAKYLKEKFGTPYVAGVPVGAFREALLQTLREAAATGKNRIAYLEVLGHYRTGDEGKTAAGEPVTMGSVAADQAIREKRGCDLICLTETADSLIADTDAHPQGEEEIRAALARYDEVTADPMLRHVCRKDAVFHELPHFAYSGRLFQNRIPALIK